LGALVVGALRAASAIARVTANSAARRPRTGCLALMSACCVCYDRFIGRAAQLFNQFAFVHVPPP
jgi:hypothetical protein